jgi:hypothetical protein
MLTAPRQFKAAQFLRLAESKGNKTLGNTWSVPYILSFITFYIDTKSENMPDRGPPSRRVDGAHGGHHELPSR